MTKEQLQNRVGKLEVALEDRNKYIKRVRQEFAKAFGWGEKNLYDREWQAETPSWEQIFIKVGRLLSKQDYAKYENQVQNIEFNLRDIFDRLDKK